LAYRAGRVQEAAPLFEQSLRANPKPGAAVLNWLWLALAHQRLGKAEEARRWLAKAQTWLDQYADGLPARAEQESGLHLHNWLEAHVLRQEAEGLIQPPNGAKQDTPGVAR
jgi:tetratricopeptide (TPR) repeat protein